MDGAKTYYRYFRGARKSVLVGRRTFCAEALLERRVERDVMRIVVLVRSNYPENG